MGYGITRTRKCRSSPAAVGLICFDFLLDEKSTHNLTCPCRMPRVTQRLKRGNDGVMDQVDFLLTALGNARRGAPSVDSNLLNHLPLKRNPFFGPSQGARYRCPICCQPSACYQCHPKGLHSDAREPQRHASRKRARYIPVDCWVRERSSDFEKDVCQRLGLLITLHIDMVR